MLTDVGGTEEELQFEKFTAETDEWIDDVLGSLGWTRDKVLQSEDLTQCPVNHGHYVSTKSSSKHITYCAVASKGYSKEEINADQSSKFFYEKAPAVVSVNLDESTMRSILTKAGGAVPVELPDTMRRALMTLTAAQRLGLYDYCVEVAKTAQSTAHFDDEDLMLLEDQNAQSRDKPQSKLELLAKQRDLKRRRQSYRGKNTHTSKKSHTEVIRDVLNQQMEILASIWADEFKIKQENSLPEEDVGKRNNRHKGSSLLGSSNKDQPQQQLESETLADELVVGPRHSNKYQRNIREDRGNCSKRTHDKEEYERDGEQCEKRARRDRSRDRSDRRDRRIQKNKRLEQEDRYTRNDGSRDGRVEESQQEQDERYSHRNRSRDKRAESNSHRDRSRNRSREVDGRRRHRYRSGEREDRDWRNEEDERTRTLSSNELFIRKERSVRSVISRPSSNAVIKSEPDAVKQFSDIKRELTDD